MRHTYPWVGIATALAMMASAAFAASEKSALSTNQPIEISSDTLDVVQAEQKAIFSGNVIATQGTTNMRAEKMVVFYDNDSSKAASGDAAGQGISRIEASGKVIFTTPQETAQGELGVYNVATETIDLTGGNVVLTRGQNVLKGTRLTYNMATGRSILNSGGVATDASGQKKPERVRGLFVPKAAEGKAQ